MQKIIRKIIAKYSNVLIVRLVLKEWQTAIVINFIFQQAGMS